VLLREVLASSAAAPALLAITIDHALRPESAEEAQAVARLAAGLGITHRTLRWEGEKPRTGLAAAAREARYRLLAQAAREAGTDIILTGHTADDQAETVAMRQLRGDGRGLAGMAQTTLYEDAAWIVRPLLGARRQLLRDELLQRGVTWIDDPTNVDTRYERPRMRAALGRSDPADDIDALLARAGAAAEARASLGIRAATLIDGHASLNDNGEVMLTPLFLETRDEEAAAYALRILLACVGGTPHLPDATRSAALAMNLRQPGYRAALARTLAERRRDGVWLRREARGIPPVYAVDSGGVWDGRYRVSPLGKAETTTASVADAPAAKALYAAGLNAVPVLAPWRAFLPDFDLAPAQAAARLLGVPAIPQPPLRHHIVASA